MTEEAMEAFVESLPAPISPADAVEAVIDSGLGSEGPESPDQNFAESTPGLNWLRLLAVCVCCAVVLALYAVCCACSLLSVL